jgi:hypothetical protein
MLYRASHILGLEVHGKDGPIGWVDEVFFDRDHSVRALLVDLRGAPAEWKLLVGSSWIDAIEVDTGRVELFIDRNDVRGARPHEGANVALDVVSLLPSEPAPSRERAAA